MLLIDEILFNIRNKITLTFTKNHACVELIDICMVSKFITPKNIPLIKIFSIVL